MDALFSPVAVHGLASLGASSLVVLVVLLILGGRLVTRRHVLDLRHVYEERLHDRTDENAYLRQANETLTAAVIEQAQQLAELSEIGRTTQELMRSIARVAAERTGS